MNRPGGKLQKSIEEALLLEERFGAACLHDPESVRLLRRLREEIRVTDAAMLQSGVASACAVCAASGGGSCCFREMGEDYGPMELFMNLLLGSKLPQKGDLPGSCHFVGKNGCKLEARQSFCLNYFCPDLKKSPGRETLLGIQRLIGEQLLIGWELECVLTRFIKGTVN
jgi:hypothetical protein